jgi:CBS domain-containing protein
MRTRLATCSPDTPADDAMRLMLDHKMGCMLVTEGDTLLGIMTEADVLKWASEMMAKGRLEDA